MKKLLLVTTLVTSIASAPALAKTEGNYVGIDVLRASSQVKSHSNRIGEEDSPYYSHKDKDSSVGFGLNYKYAFNMNNFFVAPGAFYEKIGTEVKSGYSTSAFDPYTQSVKFNDRIGAKLDLGYDITDYFAAYVPVGVSSVGYEMKTRDVDGSDFVNTKKTGRKFGYFYGVGFSFYPVKNFAINLEYNRMSKMKLSSANSATLGEGTIKADANLDVVKLGFSYNF
jgi:opacity protein-like surface antigen